MGTDPHQRLDDLAAQELVVGAEFGEQRVGCFSAADPRHRLGDRAPHPHLLLRIVHEVHQRRYDGFAVADQRLARLVLQASVAHQGDQRWNEDRICAAAFDAGAHSANRVMLHTDLRVVQ